ncbi:hypothetical protein FDECE_9038 [Fusarium decemcellulare]|nr:hypothetical protein FDECE_9038 [Fusarium decemcellulare]
MLRIIIPKKAQAATNILWLLPTLLALQLFRCLNLCVLLSVSMTRRSPCAEEQPLLSVSTSEQRSDARKSQWHLFRYGLKVRSDNVVIWLRSITHKPSDIVSRALMCSSTETVAISAITYMWKIASDKIFARENPWVYTIILVMLYIVSTTLDYFRHLLWVRVETEASHAVVRVGFRHAMKLSRDFHVSESLPDTTKSINEGSTMVSAVSDIVFNVVPELCRLLFAITLLCVRLGEYEGFVVLISTLGMFYATSSVDSSCSQREAHDASYNLERRQHSAIQGYQEVTYFNQREHESSQHKWAQSKYKVKWVYYYTQHALVCIPQAIVLGVGLFLSLSIFYWRFSMGAATVGDFVMLATYWVAFTTSLLYFASLSKEMSSQAVKAEKFLKLLTKSPSVTDEPDAEPILIKEGKVEFKKVVFEYSGRNPVIKNVSFTVSPGRIVALVGPSGAGKSTILDLLMRQHLPKSGSIMIDDQDIKSVTGSSICEQIAIVPQKPFIWDLTIAENIKYGRADAAIEEVQEVCKEARIHEKIMSLPQGYESKVGSEGAGIDAPNAQRIRQYIAAQGCTTIIIAHDLSMVVDVDMIYYFERGVIKERGTHQELIDAGGNYHKFWASQSRAISKDN